MRAKKRAKNRDKPATDAEVESIRREVKAGLYGPLSDYPALLARIDADRDRAIPADILSICARLHTQDNAATHAPVFMVQRFRRTYGFDPAYSSDSAVWMENDDYVEINDFAEYSCPHCGKVLTRGEFDCDECLGCRASFVDELHVTHTAYQDTWENVQPFFTRDGAEEYLRVNGHNIRGKEPPRIYVVGSTRNREWQAVREFLMGLVPAESAVDAVRQEPAREEGGQK